ncbi:hypothetical protein PO002_41950 [Cupriavidus necator]|uniref:hypothetical protein n=1 Tax=Cupriavidus necator TaxID=106590 RepID=UPI0039C111B0
MLKNSIIKAAVILSLVLTTTAAVASVRSAEKEGAKDGKEYARDLRNHGIEIDGTACAVGMAAMDSAKPHYSQAEIEAYAKAFGNACIGRKVL